MPFAALWVVFFLGGLLRGHVLYVVGRGIASGGRRSRFHDVFAGPRMERARLFVNRWGALAVALSYLTVGFQSFVQVSTGMAGMSVWRFTPAAVVGSMVWATIYTTIGFTVWQVWLQAVARSVWGLAGVAVVGVWLLWRLLRQRVR
nr:VTT domain-containing protein [Dermatophilus congolensis]